MSVNSLIPDFSMTQELLDLFENFGKAKHESDALSYLDKGERIINTLRGKRAKVASTFVKDDFLDAFDYAKYALFTSVGDKYDYILKRIRDQILRPAARAYVPSKKGEDGNVTEEDASVFFSILGRLPQFTLCERAAWGSPAWQVAHRVAPTTKQHLVDSVYIVSFGSGENKKELEIAFPEECHPSAGRNLQFFYHRQFKDLMYLACDFVTSFAPVFLLSELKRLFDSEIEKLERDPERDFNSSPLCAYVAAEMIALRQKYEKFGKVFLAKDVLKYPFMQRFLEETRLQYETPDYQEAKRMGVNILGISYCFMLWMVYGKIDELPITTDPWTSKYKTLGSCFWHITENVVKLFELLSDEYQEDRRVYEISEKTKKEHARSFENLRGLSEGLVESMSKSRFNDYFDFVEFDSDCLLVNDEVAFEVLDENGKVIGTETVFDHFKAIADVFGFKKREGVSLRFRKLGNHHASGLYYPDFKTICIDIRHPSSFIHEYGHMIDALAGNASRSATFYDIKTKYTNILRRAVNKDAALGERLKKGSKYDLEYYLSSTEIFARCFEMYVHRSCGINNVLISPRDQDSFAYPHDEFLARDIRDYFDAFLSFDSEELFCKLHPELEEVLLSS